VFVTVSVSDASLVQLRYPDIDAQGRASALEVSLPDAAPVTMRLYAPVLASSVRITSSWQQPCHATITMEKVDPVSWPRLLDPSLPCTDPVRVMTDWSRWDDDDDTEEDDDDEYS
jgi:hypothetical protein